MATSQPQPLGLSTLLLLVLLAYTPAHIVIASDGLALSIYNTSTVYHYVGCYNETTELQGTEQKRALDGGIMETLPDNMTVPICLDFCAKNTTTQYKFAGLEYSRECWCAQRLSTLSVKLEDGACNTQCDGDESVACGGSLKLSLYNLTAGDAKNIGTRFGGGAIEMRMLCLLLGVVAVVFMWY